MYGNFFFTLIYENGKKAHILKSNSNNESRLADRVKNLTNNSLKIYMINYKKLIYVKFDQ